METIAAFAVVIIAYGLLSRRMEEWFVSPQMAFLLVGFVLGNDVFGLVDMRLENETFLFMGEIALVITLFTDAARINISTLGPSESLATRMLTIGLPLTIAAGAVLAALLFTDLEIWEAAIIGTVLAPTDAGLGGAVVNSAKVPGRVRQALNVESGLNDGIATPVLFLFLALAEAEENLGSGQWLKSSLEQLGIGALTGILVGATCAWLISRAIRNKNMTRLFQWLSFPSMALIAWVLADQLGGNGFIAAFAGGLVTAWITHGVKESLVEFSETGGGALNFFVFFLFGAVVTTRLDTLEWSVILYAVLSLTLIRMLPVAISLIGSKLNSATVLFMGWFGPRGLASIVLGLIVLEQAETLKGLERIQDVVIWTVVLSVFAHGITTQPLISLYRKKSE